MVPPVGVDKRVGYSRDAFVRKRIRALEFFIQSVADHPYFKNDFAFVEFVTNPMPFDQVAKHIQTITGDSLGTLRWVQSLKEAPKMDVPYKKLVKQVGDELAQMIETLK